MAGELSLGHADELPSGTDPAAYVLAVGAHTPQHYGALSLRLMSEEIEANAVERIEIAKSQPRYHKRKVATGSCGAAG
ncbi:hypothetical protein GCM10009754_24590 [Amycolatopsis minnesotensis]|uniref:Uncharacterized protein n=1 Tax=Amycolatopsis minnesotensis TaxID=337894 RepID=A0ABN2QKS5_9PSEU